MDPFFLSIFVPTPMPQIVHLHDLSGKLIGEGYLSPNGRMVIRDTKGVLLGTLVNENGRVVFYDINGRTAPAPEGVDDAQAR